MNERDLSPLMGALGYRFKDESLLYRALIHSSYANESGRQLQSNERLEFLGDSVLGLTAALHLFQKEKGPEGELTKLRAAVVCEKALFSYAQQLGLGEWLLLGKGERQARLPRYRVAMPPHRKGMRRVARGRP